MTVDGESRYYTAIKNLSKLFKSLNSTHKGAYYFQMNCLNGFYTASARNKHCVYCSSNSQVKVKMPSEEEKLLTLCDNQYQFKVPFLLYADFESTLKPVDEQYRKTMHQMKSERKGKTQYTEKINGNVPSE